jgi:iron-sulfur cluster insertion protein
MTEIWIINSMSFTITSAAKEQIAKLLSKNTDKYAVSLAVLGGGCAGFKYDWGFIESKDKIQKTDHVEEWDSGRFVVDSISMFYVMGTVIDWREEVFGSQFEISNPNAKSGCGCGESFGV